MTGSLCRVLRLRDGACLELCDGNGGLAMAELRGIAHNNKAYVETIENIRQVLLLHMLHVGPWACSACMRGHPFYPLLYLISTPAGGLARAKVGGGSGVFQPQGWASRLDGGEVHRAGRMGRAAHSVCEISTPRYEDVE